MTWNRSSWARGGSLASVTVTADRGGGRAAVAITDRVREGLGAEEIVGRRVEQTVLGGGDGERAASRQAAEAQHLQRLAGIGRHQIVRQHGQRDTDRVFGDSKHVVDGRRIVVRRPDLDGHDGRLLARPVADRVGKRLVAEEIGGRHVSDRLAVRRNRHAATMIGRAHRGNDQVTGRAFEDLVIGQRIERRAGTVFVHRERVVVGIEGGIDSQRRGPEARCRRSATRVSVRKSNTSLDGRLSDGIGRERRGAGVSRAHRQAPQQVFAAAELGHPGHRPGLVDQAGRRQTSRRAGWDIRRRR